MNNPLITSLNSEQQLAVETTEGPVLVIAGPGSGKTRVITTRVSHLINNGVNPFNIGVLTFTNKAAKEIKERLENEFHLDSHNLTTGTFHSFCSKVLRQDGSIIGIPNNFVIFDDGDQIDAIKRSLLELELDAKQFSPRVMLSIISNAKSELKNYETFQLNKSNYFDEKVGQVYERYSEILQNSSALDFDDLLMNTHKLFDSQPQISENYDNRFDYFMVDEFQDTNIAQYQITKLICNKKQNLCVVGDPDQSIYSWRNADIRNILSFQKDYPKTKIISLEQNYRSTKTILNAAQKVIEKNDQRVDKKLWTSNDQGSMISVLEGYDQDEEAQITLSEIKTLIQSKKYALSDIAIMYRVNAQSRALEMACQRNSIPYQLIGGIKFYHRKEIKDLIAYLRIILNPNDDISLARVINTPTRGIGKKSIDEINRISSIHNQSFYQTIINICNESSSPQPQIGTRGLTSIKNFYKIIDNLIKMSQKINLLNLIDEILDVTGYEKFLLNDEQMEERFENIDEFKTSASTYMELSTTEALNEFLESISLVADIDNFDAEEHALTLITLHQSKGLEFPIVFMVGMEENLLPHRRAIESGEPHELEEERRLCYVGMTRAKDKLFMLKCFRRAFQGSYEPSLPSRFLSDLPKENIIFGTSSKLNPTPEIKPVRKRIINADNQSIHNNVISSNDIFSPGDKVIHKTFGEGIITSSKQVSNDYELTIAFKNSGGIKKLLASLANLSKV